jgi:hypothetical protein
VAGETLTNGGIVTDTNETTNDRREQGRSTGDVRRMVLQFVKDGALVALMVLVWRASSGFTALDAKVIQIEKDNARRDVLTEKMSDAIQIIHISNQKNQQQDAELIRLGSLLDKGKDERLKWQTDTMKLLQEIVVNGVETKLLLQNHLKDEKP